ncbi:tetratricopeptide repeat protein [Roseimicrobium sp. ORNL1]|uniref:protein kinase domain-containing protein n=1 Tax=Roseimicrobium sp. ORNL1 TaxID=2711231 RepID=UPI0019823B3F|nr:tetratricopeptide repeat protein [Roseimicrobium sp. ORNL1]
MASADRLIEVFNEAKARAAGPARDQFLADACGDDLQMREQVLSLLRADDGAGAFLEKTIPLPREIETEMARFKPEQAGDHIGPYTLREQLGEGGFGVVWVAEQVKPVRRTVALKIIKLGMDTRDVVARFEQERQALAMMDHPNIARVFDAGVTDHGRPFFVMELVHGVRITEYCDKANLPTVERLKLFISVCHAVQHAHQKGIIHRDLKPSNILVTLHDGVPVPKVIDFGVAKATQGRVVEQTIHTQFHQMIGTPLYMSPEQVELGGLDVDTRADIYVLGVLLYELLTGRTPFDAKVLLKAGYDEMRRVLREQEPQRPSTALTGMTQEKLSSVAQKRGSEPPKLIHAIRGDLDWIVMKCLEKDRARRYETANGLAADIQRHLDNDPVSACPPSAMYRFRKLARRHRGALAIACVATMAMLLGLAGLIVSNVLITQQKDEKVAALEQSKINEQAANRNAVKAREQEQIAEANELLARRRYYAAQMNLAMQAWHAGEMPRVLELLESQRPSPGEEDFRGFEWYYLWRLCQGGDRVPIRGHDQTVLGLAFSPNGKTLASASWDRTVRLWDTATGTEQKVLRCNHGPWEVAFSPDGKMLASSGQEAKTMILWDVESGKALQTIDGAVVGARFTPDGKSIVGGQHIASGNYIKEWDAASGQERSSFADSSFVIGLSVERGTVITSTGIDNGDEIRVWDWPSGKRRLTIPVRITTATSSPDCSRVAVSSWGKILLWDTTNGICKATYSLDSFARGLAFSPDGKRLAAGLENRRVVVYDIESGKQIAEDVHLDPIWGLAFSPNGKSLASSTLAGAIKLWDMMPAEEATTFSGIEPNPGLPEGSRRCLRFTPDSKSLLVGSKGLTRVIDVKAGKEVAVLPASGVGAISADGNVLVGSTADGGFELWDVRAGSKVPAISVSEGSKMPKVIVSPDGGTLASYYPWSSNSTVTLHDVTKAMTPRVLPSQSNTLSVISAAFSSDGKLLASGYHFQWVVVWDLATGEAKWRIYQEPGMMVVVSVAFSPDGKSLAIGTDGGAVTLWDMDTGKQRVAFRGHTSFVNALAFSPDSRVLATAGNDKTVRLWDVVTGQERGTLTGHTGAVMNVAFSPDGFTLATASGDGTVKLWRGATDALALAPRKDVPWIPSGPFILPTGAIALTEEALREAALRWPNEPEFLKRLAELLPSGGRMKEASMSLADVLLPGSYELYRDRSAVLREMGKLPEAEAALREAIRLKPDAGSLHLKLGEILEQQNKLPEAMAAYQEAVRLDSSDHDSRAKVGWTQFNMAKFAEAESEFRELIRLRPDYFDGYFGLGRALASQSKHAEAAVPLRVAIRLNPNHAGPHGSLAWVLMKLGQFPEAEMEFRAQHRLARPNSSFGLHGLGSALMKQRKYTEAMVPLRDLARLEPENYLPHETLGWAFLLTGEPAKAEAEFREVIRLKPTLVTGHWGLGRVLVEQRKYADAEAALREAIRLEPTHAEAPHWLRQALTGQGKPIDAEIESLKKLRKGQGEQDKNENTE